MERVPGGRVRAAGPPSWNTARVSTARPKVLRTLRHVDRGGRLRVRVRDAHSGAVAAPRPEQRCGAGRGAPDDNRRHDAPRHVPRVHLQAPAGAVRAPGAVLAQRVHRLRQRLPAHQPFRHAHVPPVQEDREHLGMPYYDLEEDDFAATNRRLCDDPTTRPPLSGTLRRGATAPQRVGRGGPAPAGRAVGAALRAWRRTWWAGGRVGAAGAHSR